MGSVGQPTKQFHVKSVAIIGAGPSGIVSAKYLKAQGAFESIVIFERQDEIGGIWNYTDTAPEPCPFPQDDPFWPEPPVWDGVTPAPLFPSAMYDRLHTNGIKRLMKYGDQAFAHDDRLFPKREVVQGYLHRYAEDVRGFIRFRSRVERISLQPEAGIDRWLVDAVSTVDGRSVFHGVFDAVVVANGHYAIPHVPRITNLEAFHRAHPLSISHSKGYRRPEPFLDKRVVVVGSGFSGLDIARQINQVAAQTFISSKSPMPPGWLEHTGCQGVAEIDEFLTDRRGILLKDGTVIADIDHFVFCTGFLYSYPFLPDLQHDLITTGKGVHGLYQHLFHIKHPTLVFPALTLRSVTWPMSEVQAAVFSSVWSNSLALPSADEMAQWSQDLERKKGASLHGFDIVEDGHYINELYDWCLRSTNCRKEPPRWDDEQFWMKRITMQVKIRFEKGECRATTMEELGFRHDPQDNKGESRGLWHP